MSDFTGTEVIIEYYLQAYCSFSFIRYLFVTEKMRRKQKYDEDVWTGETKKLRECPIIEVQR